MMPDISCVECRAQLVDYAAGTLPVEARDIAARHLESCSACARELEQWQEIGLAVRQVSVPPPEQSFDTAWGYLQAHLDVAPSGLETKAQVHWLEEAVKPKSMPYLQRGTGGRMRILAAFAAVLALAVVSAGVFATLAIHRNPLASGTASPRPSQLASPTAYPTPVPTAPPPGHTAGWQIVASPLDTSVDAGLSAVAAVSANDVWAVGSITYDHGTYASSGPTYALIEHWNGSSWSIVPNPRALSTDSANASESLSAVSAVSADDVWAVGSYMPNPDVGPPMLFQTLIEHWDGTSWSIVPSPNLGISSNQLNGVTAVSANDVWAVGSGGNETLVEHWNGTSWSIVPSPITLTQAVLNGVTAVSAIDVWAVGYINSNTAEEGDQSDTLIEHWNGANWSMMPSPDKVPSSVGYIAFNTLNAVSAVSADDIWAVGYSEDTSPKMVAEHWNGTSWSIVHSPSIGSSSSTRATDVGFRSVVAISANDVWAVGYGDSGNGNIVTLIEHWNGKAWNIAPSPDGHYGQNVLYGVAAVSADDIWAVGSDLPRNFSGKELQGFIIQGP